MGTRDRWIILAAALVMLAGLGGAVSLTPRINDERSYLQLTVTDNATKAVAPEYAWTQALGSFKGLFIDMLWIRIEQMKNEGKYHEAMRLSEFITMLQPRFPTVWADRAWNLAYNISVGTHTKAERWMWVRAGIRLLRDEGIPNNPRAVQLYKELAWIYIHKIGQFSDDANWYYKTELARRWHFLLGPPPEGTTDEVIAWFRPIAEAYEDFLPQRYLGEPIRKKMDAMIKADDGVATLLRPIRHLGVERVAIRLRRLVEAFPGSDSRRLAELKKLLADIEAQIARNNVPLERRLVEADPTLGRQVEALRAHGFELNEDLLEKIGGLRAVQVSEDLKALGYEDKARYSDAEKWLKGWLADPDRAGLRDRLLAVTRAKVLVEEHKMDPSWMLQLMEGWWFVREDNKATIAPEDVPRIPVDWRHPCAHGLYWSSMGVRQSHAMLRPQDADILNTDRHMIHSLQGLMQTGKIVFDPASGYYSIMKDPRYIEAYHQAVGGVNERIDQFSNESLKKLVPSSFLAGHENFLAEAVVMEYMYGRESVAGKYYDTLRRLYSGLHPDRRYEKPLEEFVTWSFVREEAIISPENATAAIIGMLHRAIVQGMVNGQRELGSRRYKMAQYMYKKYSSKQDVFGPKIGAKAGRHRMALPPFNRMYADALGLFMAGAASPVGKARAWRNAPVEIKQPVYDRMHERLATLAKRAGLDPAKAFPEPPGMDEYRKNKAAADPADSQLKSKPLNEK